MDKKRAKTQPTTTPITIAAPLLELGVPIWSSVKF